MKLISLGSVFLLCLAVVSVIVAENREEEIQQLLGLGRELWIGSLLQLLSITLNVQNLL